MNVSIVQHDIVWEAPAANFARLDPLIARAAVDADLVVLTEMYSTGFSMATERVAEPPDGASTDYLRDRASAHGVWLCGSAPVRTPGDERPANRLVLASPEGELHHYDKIHPFSYGREHEHYRAGHQFLTVPVAGVRCSFFVCYDLRFADEFWALARDTDCYVVVANWPEARRHHWRSLLVARAIENQAYVVGANRVGDGRGIAYAGDSMIVDPLGEVLAGAARVETIVAGTVDASTVTKVREEFPFFQDRR